MSDSTQAARLAPSAGAALGHVPTGGAALHESAFANFNPDRGLAATASLLKRLLGKFEGNLAMPPWNGDPSRSGSVAPHEGPPPFTLVIRNPGAVAPGLDRLRFAQACVRGDADIEGWNNTLSTEFIDRHLFPDGQLATVSNVLHGMERSGFEIADVESLRPHDALTLRRWVASLERHHDEAPEHIEESTCRCWRLYTAACTLEFDPGEIGVYQLLASKRTTALPVLRLTRGHLHCNDPALEGKTS